MGLRKFFMKKIDFEDSNTLILISICIISIFDIFILSSIRKLDLFWHDTLRNVDFITFPNIVTDKKGGKRSDKHKIRLRNGLKIQSPQRARPTFLSAMHDPVCPTKLRFYHRPNVSNRQSSVGFKTGKREFGEMTTPYS